MAAVGRVTAPCASLRRPPQPGRWLLVQLPTSSSPGTGRAGQFLEVQSNGPAWVTFYSSKAARTADATRQRTSNPEQGDGVLMELFFDQAETLLISPAVHYFNNDPSNGAEVFAKVVNDDTVSRDIEIVATVVPIEGRALYEAEGTVRTVVPQFATSLLAPDASEDLTLVGVARALVSSSRWRPPTLLA